MAKSIEVIWKEGFMKSDPFIVPKLNDLYNQKSQNIIDKLEHMFKLNLIAIIVAAAILLLASFWVGLPYLGTGLFLLLSSLVLFGKKELDQLEKIDKGTNSYQYLKTFDRWLKSVIASYTKIYRIVYPCLFLIFIAGFWLSRYGSIIQNKLLIHYPNMHLTFGIPTLGLVGTIILASLSSIFAGTIYKIDMHLVYGPVMKKLEELITDMEELRS